MAKKTPLGVSGKGKRGISTAGWLLRGAAAGAAGSTALNAVTYLDMVVRGRGTSSTPERTRVRSRSSRSARSPSRART